MTSKTFVKDKSSLHHYRTELPNLIDDMQLSVYAFRLYAHLKRVAGDGGVCFEGTRKLAAVCCMAVGQVVKAKAELERAGVILRTTESARGGQQDYITIADLWAQNFRAYCKDFTEPAVMPSDESVHHTNTSESVQDMNTLPEEAFTTRTLSGQSVHESVRKRSPHERIKEHEEKPTPPPTENAAKKTNGDGGDSFTFLTDQGIGAASEFAHIPLTIIKADYDARKADGQTKATIVKAWRARPPTASTIFGQSRASPSAPLIATQPNVPDQIVSRADMARLLNERKRPDAAS